MDFFIQLSFLNILLMVFNLFPVPPLDGSRVLDIFLPTRISLYLSQNERAIGIGFMMVIVVLGFMGISFIQWVATPIFSGMLTLLSIPFQLLLGGL